jgi:hypothetical protein
VLYHRFGGSHVSEECCLIDEVQKEIVMLRLCTYDAIAQCHFSGLEIYVWRIFSALHVVAIITVNKGAI